VEPCGIRRFSSSIILSRLSALAACHAGGRGFESRRSRLKHPANRHLLLPDSAQTTAGFYVSPALIQQVWKRACLQDFLRRQARTRGCHPARISSESPETADRAHPRKRRGSYEEGPAPPLLPREPPSPTNPKAHRSSRGTLPGRLPGSAATGRGFRVSRAGA
jgi:hypothetical protein